MSTEGTPRYIEEANFIQEDEEVDEYWWPRDPYRYDPTEKWKKRMRRLGGIVNSEDVNKAIQLGEVYRAANNNITFVNDLSGIVIYTVMDAELQKRGDEYPTDPQKSDYWFKGVTVWPYLYDRDKAWNTGRWTGRELDEVEQIRKENQEVYK